MSTPKLRFKGFTENWNGTELGELLSFKNGINAAKEDYGFGYKFINVLDIIQNDFITHDSIIGEVNITESDFKKNNVEYGDILFQRSSETREEVGQANVYLDKDNPATFGGFVIRGKMESDYNPSFLNCLLKTSSARKEITTKSGGSTRFNVSQGTLSEVKIILPSLPEQEKIADFLSTVDKKIQALTKKKDLLVSFKQGVMQKIFKQEIRFKKDDGGDYPEWEEQKLSDILMEHKQKSTGDEEVYSVSVHKGLINQIEHLGRSFAAKNKSNYNLVYPYDIIYTKSPTGEFPYGIIKQSRIEEKVIVSPLYGVFSPKNKWLGYIINDFFCSIQNVHNYLHPIIQKGAKNTINITNSRFLSRDLKLPVSSEEQKRIAKFLLNLDDKINLVASQRDKMKQWKKGLLQQMFV